jgi:hypothetical protein
MTLLVLFGLVIPLLTGAVYEFSHDNRTLAGICLLAAIILAGFGLNTFYRGLTACSSDAEILSGNILETPDEDRCRQVMSHYPGPITLIHLGSSMFFVVPPFQHQEVLVLNKHALLSIDRSEQGIGINSELFDESGNLIAAVRHNKIDSSGWLSCQRPNLNTLVVSTLWGREMLYVQARNAFDLELRGYFSYPDTDPVRITSDRIDRGTDDSAMPPMSCVGAGNVGALINLGD